MINITKQRENQITKLYDTLSAPIASARESVAERIKEYIKLLLYCKTGWWVIFSRDERN